MENLIQIIFFAFAKFQLYLRGSTLRINNKIKVDNLESQGIISMNEKVICKENDKNEEKLAENDIIFKEEINNYGTLNGRKNFRGYTYNLAYNNGQ